MSQTHTTIIRVHNDRFRSGDANIPGTMVMTESLVAHMRATGAPEGLVLRLVQEFADFDHENDPYGQHDFGTFDLYGERCFWKIDLYDTDQRYGTPDATDLTVTHRVLTIMLAADY